MSRRKGWERGRKEVGRPRALRRILILSEDEKSSVHYLRAFPYDRTLVEIECVGTGLNTDSLMQEAIRRMKAARNHGAPCAEIWVVFDRDSFPQERFNRAFDLARNHAEIRPCWSNECFELWYLLHFDLRDTAVGREDLCREVGRLLGRRYDKADCAIHALLQDRQANALKNAKKLESQNYERGQPRGNPSTHVHHLVQRLLEFDPVRLDED